MRDRGSVKEGEKEIGFVDEFRCGVSEVVIKF